MEETIDPTVKLTKLVRENNYEDAFNMALSLGDVAIVSWLCDQVGLSLFYDIVIMDSAFCTHIAARKCSILYRGLAAVKVAHLYSNKQLRIYSRPFTSRLCSHLYIALDADSKV